jgi:hypothetical protein
MFVDPYNGYSCFVSSILGYFDWYNKNGGRGWRVCVLSPLAACLGGLGVSLGVGENLWRTKAEAYGSYYAAVRKEINTLSRRA